MRRLMNIGYRRGESGQSRPPGGLWGMRRLSSIFIALCMILIAGSLGGVLFLAFKFDAVTAAIVALCALICMTTYNFMSNRVRDRTDLGDQIADLSRGTADLARQVAEIGRRLNAMETRVDSTVSKARGAVDPLAAEIGELGNLVRQLADSVAAHETELRSRPVAAAPSPSTAPGQPEPEAPAVADKVELGEPDPKFFAPASSGFGTMSRDGIVAALSSAIDANRIDLYLQPIVTLPQRKVR